MQLDALMGKNVSVIPHFTFSQSAPEPFSSDNSYVFFFSFTNEIVIKRKKIIMMPLTLYYAIP